MIVASIVGVLVLGGAATWVVAHRPHLPAGNQAIAASFAPVARPALSRCVEELHRLGGYSRSASQGPCWAGTIHPWFVATVTNRSADGLTPTCSVTAFDRRLRRLFRGPLEHVPGGLLTQIPARGSLTFEWYLPVHGQIATMVGVCHEQRPEGA